MALTQAKLDQKRATLIERTALALRVSPEKATELLSIGRQQSLRLNTLKQSAETTLAALHEHGATIILAPWSPDCAFIQSGIKIIRDSKETSDGEAYIQNAASWLPVLALHPQPGETILDVCAAPGGKTSHIAQLSENKAFITANDNSRPRLHKLQNNLDRMGAKNVTFTLHDATRLGRTFEGESFDKILLDAPCSGEGMMTLANAKDFESWSVAHIKRLQQLQKKIIIQAWNLLKPGGRLVYSTCTMAPEENEAVIDYLLRRNEDASVEPLPQLVTALDNRSDSVLSWNGKQYDERIKESLRLHPSERVEAFFVVSLIKAK